MLVGLFYILLAVFVTVGVGLALLHLQWILTLETLIALALCAVLAAGAALFLYIGVTTVWVRDRG